jgi:predicted PurR-regulated permease PerM
LENVYFLIAAIALYFISNWLLERVEVAIGRRLENRSLVFFFILLTLALVSFALIRRLTA